jgi:hypothetical protein
MPQPENAFATWRPQPNEALTTPLILTASETNSPRGWVKFQRDFTETVSRNIRPRGITGTISPADCHKQRQKSLTVRCLQAIPNPTASPIL